MKTKTIMLLGLLSFSVHADIDGPPTMGQQTSNPSGTGEGITPLQSETKAQSQMPDASKQQRQEEPLRDESLIENAYPIGPYRNGVWTPKAREDAIEN